MAHKSDPVKREHLTDAEWDRVSLLFAAIARAKRNLRERESRR